MDQHGKEGQNGHIIKNPLNLWIKVPNDQFGPFKGNLEQKAISQRIGQKISANSSFPQKLDRWIATKLLYGHEWTSTKIRSNDRRI